jgi:hypothetical protein
MKSALIWRSLGLTQQFPEQKAAWLSGQQELDDDVARFLMEAANSVTYTLGKKFSKGRDFVCRLKRNSLQAANEIGKYPKTPAQWCCRPVNNKRLPTGRVAFLAVCSRGKWVYLP